MNYQDEHFMMNQEMKYQLTAERVILHLTI